MRGGGHPRALRIFSWTLATVGVALLLLLSWGLPLRVFSPLLLLVPLTLLTDSFTFQVAESVYLSLETIVCLFSALLLGPVVAAWTAGISVMLDELFILRRGPHFAARSAGMYVLMWLAGGFAYQAVGGTFPLTQLELTDLIRVLFFFLVTALVNRALMGVDRVLRGFSLREYLVDIVPRTLLMEVGFVAMGAVMAVAYARIGPVATTVLAVVMLLALALGRQLRQTSEKLERRVMVLGVLNYVGRLIGGSLELERLLDLVYEGASHLFDTSRFWIALCDPERDELIYEALYDEGQRRFSACPPCGLDTALVSYMVEHREPVLARTREEVEALPLRLTTVEGGESPASVLGVPMMAKGKVVGVIVVQSCQPRAFDQEDLETLMTLANQAAVALENVRLFQEVEEGRRYLRTVLDAVDHALVVTDTEGRVRLTNRAMAELFGISEEEALGRPLTEVVGHEALVDVARRLLHGEPTGPEGVPVKLSDGRALVAHLAPVVDGQGSRIGYVMAMADVTPLHEFSELKSRMIRVASHDLRNPLHLAGGFFKILVDDLHLTEEQANLVQRVQANLETMEHLIDDLLDLERIERPQPAQQELVDLGALVQAVVRDQRLRAELRQQQLVVEVEADLPRVKGDSRMLAQAVTNLVDNAIKYTPMGGKIWVRLWSEEGRVLLSVKDTGVGIPPDDQPRIFEQFFRANQPGVEKVSGMGLGLSLVREIVQQHGGQVWVESEGVPGKGSTFTIALPAL